MGGCGDLLFVKYFGGRERHSTRHFEVMRRDGFEAPFCGIEAGSSLQFVGRGEPDNFHFKITPFLSNIMENS